MLDPDFSIVESARAGATGYSFPSGHTQNAFSSFGCLGMWAKGGWRALCFAIVVLIGFSRMYLGVHTPLDVGVAFVLGLVLMLALYPVFRDIEAHPGRMYGIIGGMIALTLAYLCYVELWPFPSDIDAANLAPEQRTATSCWAPRRRCCCPTGWTGGTSASIRARLCGARF